KQRLNDLDFFESVVVERIPGSEPDKTSVKVGVTEKSTGSLSLGFGFSTTAGALADVGITERNLMGRGQYLSLKAMLSGSGSQIDLNFTEPYFLGRDVAAGFGIFHSSTDRQDASSFETKQTGVSLRVGYPITEDLRQSWNHTLKRSEVTDVPSSASQYVKDEEGAEIESTLSHSLVYDKRDSKTTPTDGYVLRLSNDLAGIGGSKRYMRNVISGGRYFPIYDQWVLNVGGSTGYIFGIGEDVGLLDRFFIGGDDLRGFATSGVGPRDSTTKDALGGEWMYKGSVELKFPLGLPEELGVSGKVFSDFGSSGKLNTSVAGVNDTGALRASIGTGIAWVSPFGPISIDFGFPILKEDFDEDEVVRVNFGTRF
ncbi:MAG: outer membrane protein assembly factor BamA, partial [Alphaproteobacteria bacterium]